MCNISINFIVETPALLYSYNNCWQPDIETPALFYSYKNCWQPDIETPALFYSYTNCWQPDLETPGPILYFTVVYNGPMYIVHSISYTGPSFNVVTLSLSVRERKRERVC